MVTKSEYQTIQLTRVLVRLILEPENSDWIRTTHSDLSSASEKQWKEAVSTLATHRLIPAVFHAIKKNHLGPFVPSTMLPSMAAAALWTSHVNQQIFKMVGKVVNRLADQSIFPICTKGIVLADSFYEDPAMRPMSDFDFVISEKEQPIVHEVLIGAGFCFEPELETADAIYLRSKNGVVCDLHKRFRLYERFKMDELSHFIEPRFIQSSVLRIFDANAMIVHLSEHMRGHLPETGPLLSWLVDLALVIRKRSNEISFRHIQELMPDNNALNFYLHAVRFLQKEFGFVPPRSIASAACSSQTVGLAETLSQRKLTMWGLPTISGLLHYGAFFLGLYPADGLPSLSFWDLTRLSSSFCESKRRWTA